MVRPCRLPEHGSDAPPQVEGLVEQRPVLRDRPVPVLDEQVAPQVPVTRLVEEWVELRVVEADAEGAASLTGRQPFDVCIREAGQLLAIDVDPIAVLVDVALEGDLDLDEPGPEALELGAVLG